MSNILNDSDAAQLTGRVPKNHTVRLHTDATGKVQICGFGTGFRENYGLKIKIRVCLVLGFKLGSVLGL